jgi:glycosyltransferase involved in cell wall biosynthesis
MNLQGSGALFVMSKSVTGQIGPVAVWITAAGWAGAARRRWGRAWIVTPQGVLTPEEAHSAATAPSLAPRKDGWRRHVPRAAAVAIGDLRRIVEGRRFRRSALDGPWIGEDLAFVWQRHDLFQWAGFEAARSLNKPLVLFVDALMVWEARKWGVRRLGYGRLYEMAGEWRQLRSADLVACVSEEVAEQVRLLGLPEERILVTPCGVDVTRFHPDVSPDEVRSRYALKDRFVVGWVGSFRPFHQVHLALEAAAVVQDEVPELVLLLAGDGPERPRLETRARDLGLQAVFTGTVPYAEMPQHIAAMDAALVLDSGETEFHYSPLKLREYMACARAIIAPRVGQVARSLNDEVDALLVEPGSHTALAAALRRLHGDPELRTALGEAARDRALREGSWDTQLDRTLEQLSRSGVNKSVARS